MAAAASSHNLLHRCRTAVGDKVVLMAVVCDGQIKLTAGAVRRAPTSVSDSLRTHKTLFFFRGCLPTRCAAVFMQVFFKLGAGPHMGSPGIGMGRLNCLV